jgi:polar amino acid transport system ATP-binding protein
VFDGESSGRESAAQKRKKQLAVGLVFQSFNLFPQYTALKNITLASELAAKDRPDYKKNKKQIRGEIREHGLDLLNKVGLSDKADYYPWQLSGGQQQRVSIARALCMEPSILFFDEPTSALDPELTGEILRVIRGLAQTHMTMVIVTHEMSFARDVSDEILFMNRGVIEERGTPEQIFTSPKSARLRDFINHYSD